VGAIEKVFLIDRPQQLGTGQLHQLVFQRRDEPPLTAHTNNPRLGWATITHPFHPLRTQRFKVLKTRRVAGVDTLILRHPDRGSYTVVQEWTDWGLPETCLVPAGAMQKRAVEPLLQLANLLAELRARTPQDLDE
jgi:hypothetical protein